MIPRLRLTPPRDRSLDAARRRLNDQLFAAQRAELERRERVLEDFLISGAMPRDLTQIIHRRWTGSASNTYQPGEPVLVDLIAEDWRVN